MTAIRQFLAFFSVRRISGQIAMLVAASLITGQLMVTAFFFFHRSNSQPAPERPRRELGTLAQLVNATPLPERPRVLDDIHRAFPLLAIDISSPNPDAAHNDPVKPPPGYPLRLAPGFHAFMLPGPDNRVGIRLPDGALLTARLGADHSPPWLAMPWAVTLPFVLVSFTLLGLWAACALGTPLSAFATAAENFSLNSTAAPLAENGPEEIRSLARALNRMRERITTLMNDRTRMLAAISHDLRTPITRLRLRSEFIEDELHRRQTLIDLDQMRAMLESVLSFLRNDHTRETVTLVDLTAMLHLICDQFSDLGHKVSYRGPAHATLVARPDDLHRALTNLVGNAVRFGTIVSINLGISDQQAIIEVEDDGPGIDDARKAAMLEPFVRGDEARNMDESTGFGLGLSIARAIVTAHNGMLSLLNREPTGLTVRIVLPRGAERKSAA